MLRPAGREILRRAPIRYACACAAIRGLLLSHAIAASPRLPLPVEFRRNRDAGTPRGRIAVRGSAYCSASRLNAVDMCEIAMWKALRRGDGLPQEAEGRGRLRCVAETRFRHILKSWLHWC